MTGLLRAMILAGAICAALVAAAGSSPGTARTLHYVALGDSFSSGEGDPPYKPETDRLFLPHDLCHRSKFAYPALVHGTRGGPFAFWACSGAQIGDMTSANHQNPVERAQLDRLAPPGRSDPSVGLVTLTIGGNDAEFGVALACVASRVAAPFLCPGDWRATVEAATRRLRSTLPPVLRALRARAPKATILLLGYPDPFPPALRPGSRCSGWFAPGDIAWTKREGAALNDSLRTAARASGARITYVPPTGFAGHDVCSQDPWFNPLELAPTGIRGSFHPTARGQQQLAREILAQF